MGSQERHSRRQEVPIAVVEGEYDRLASITLLSIFLLSGTIFRNILGRGVERPIVAAEH